MSIVVMVPIYYGTIVKEYPNECEDESIAEELILEIKEYEEWTGQQISSNWKAINHCDPVNAIDTMFRVGWQEDFIQDIIPLAYPEFDKTELQAIIDEQIYCRLLAKLV